MLKCSRDRIKKEKKFVLHGENFRKVFVLHKFCDPKIVVSVRLSAEDLPHRALSSVGLRFCFFGQFSTEGTEVKSASVTKTEVEI
jgi:hypothetical protein